MTTETVSEQPATSKTLAVMAVLVLSMSCLEAEAGCGTESERYVQQTTNISAQALPCTEAQESDVPGKLVLPKSSTHDRVEISNARPKVDATENQPFEESATVNVWELIKDNLWKVFSLLGIIFVIREKPMTGSILSASGTIVG